MDWTQVLTIVGTVVGSSASVVGLIYMMLRNFKSDVMARINSLETKLDKLAEEVKDIDRRLCRIEGAMASKDCCMLKDDQLRRKIE